MKRKWTQKELEQEEIVKIIKAVKKILSNAIKLGGTTIKNFVVSDQEVGYFKNKLMVYGRDGLPCLRCKDKNVIRKLVIINKLNAQRGLESLNVFFFIWASKKLIKQIIFYLIKL